MNNLLLDEKKIDKLVSSYQDTEQLIHEGSDEHLDIILEIQNSLKTLIKLSVDVNEELEKAFNYLNSEKAKDVVIKLSVGLRNAKQLIVALRNTHPSIFKGIKSSCQDLSLETKQIDEFVQDLIKYKITDPVELKKVVVK